MKNPRTLLIEQAATDDADEGTAWRDRMEAWLATDNSGWSDASWAAVVTDLFGHE